MRNVRNITVTAEVYRQARIYAANHDTTVTGVVAFLLQSVSRIPIAMCAGCPRYASALLATQAQASLTNPPPSPEKMAFSGREAAEVDPTGSFSSTCEGYSGENTAAVKLGADRNDLISNDLEDNSTGRTAAVKLGDDHNQLILNGLQECPTAAQQM